MPRAKSFECTDLHPNLFCILIFARLMLIDGELPQRIATREIRDFFAEAL